MTDTVESNGKQKTIRIDATDLLILRWFADFYAAMRKRIIDGKEYGWVKRSKVIEDLPILGISETAVSERFKKLVHFGLLEYQLVKDGGTYCYFRHGERFDELVSTKFSTIGSDGICSNAQGVSVQTDTGVSVQTHNKDSELKDNSIKDTGRSKISSGKRTYPFQCPDCGSNVYRNTAVNYDECQGCFRTFPH